MGQSRRGHSGGYDAGKHAQELQQEPYPATQPVAILPKSPLPGHRHFLGPMLSGPPSLQAHFVARGPPLPSHVECLPVPPCTLFSIARPSTFHSHSPSLTGQFHLQASAEMLFLCEVFWLPQVTGLCSASYFRNICSTHSEFSVVCLQPG